MKTVTLEVLMETAVTISLLSPDPYMKVGCMAAITDDYKNFRRIIGGFNRPPYFQEGNKTFFSNRETRRPHMIHAEIDMTAELVAAEYGYTPEGFELVVAITLFPCVHCMNLLGAMRVKTLYYKDIYDKDRNAIETAVMHGINIVQV